MPLNHRLPRQRLKKTSYVRLSKRQKPRRQGVSISRLLRTVGVEQLKQSATQLSRMDIRYMGEISGFLNGFEEAASRGQLWHPGEKKGPPKRAFFVWFSRFIRKSKRRPTEGVTNQKLMSGCRHRYRSDKNCHTCMSRLISRQWVVIHGVRIGAAWQLILIANAIVVRIRRACAIAIVAASG